LPPERALGKHGRVRKRRSSRSAPQKRNFKEAKFYVAKFYCESAFFVIKGSSLSRRFFPQTSFKLTMKIMCQSRNVRRLIAAVTATIFCLANLWSTDAHAINISRLYRALKQ